MLGTMKRTNWWIAVGVFLIPLAYVGSYAALVKRHEYMLLPGTDDTRREYKLLRGTKGFTPNAYVIYEYRIVGKVAERVFMPINQLERRFRSEKTATH